MITPLDIQNKVFSKGVRGYREEEVDEFLDLITMDMEKLITENAALKAQVNKQEEDIKKYKGSEDAVLDTLEAAKRLMGDISASAEKRAEILLKNAELDAELIQREARENVERLTEENLRLKHRFSEFKMRYKSLLESELERFETMSSEIYSQYGMDDLREITKPAAAPDASATAVFSADNSKTAIFKGSSDLSKTIVNLKMNND